MLKKVIGLCGAALLSGALFLLPEVEAADASAVLDGVSLAPVKTGYTKLDEDVKVLLGRITTPTMSTSQKVQACYDWLIENCHYAIPTIVMTPAVERNIEFVRADKMLRDRYGVCDDYANAFAAMVRAIGLNCRVAKGLTADGPNGMVGHAWCVITVDGEDYIFDPQVDDELARGGEIGYYRYCKTEEETGENYQFRTYKRQFPSIEQKRKTAETASMSIVNGLVEIDGMQYSTLGFPNYKADFVFEPMEGLEYLDDKKDQLYFTQPGEYKIIVKLWEKNRLREEFLVVMKIETEEETEKRLSEEMNRSASDGRYVENYKGNYGQLMLNNINRARVNFGLPPVRATKEMMVAAHKRAAELSSRFSNTRPNGSKFNTILPGVKAECISRIIAEPEDVINNLIVSASRDDLLNPNYRKVGIGYFNNPDSRKQGDLHLYCILLQ